MSEISKYAFRAEGEIAARDHGHASGTISEIIQSAIDAAVAEDRAKHPRIWFGEERDIDMATAILKPLVESGDSVDRMDVALAAIEFCRKGAK